MNLEKYEKETKMKRVAKAKTKKKKIILTPQELEKKKAEQKAKRKTRQFKNKIKYVFTMAGFDYIKSENFHMKIGYRDIEIDAIFLYENIMIICEDTGSGTEHIKDHVRKKQEAFEQIEANKDVFFEELRNKYNELEEKLNRYQVGQYKFFYLYFSQEEIGFCADDYKLYPLIKFVDMRSLEYFYKMSQCIKRSVKYEIYRFLDITDTDIGGNTTEASQKKIKATIISPQETTGLQNGIRIVSFMMSAETLIKNCYVLRKDNWEDSATLYQRLIRKEKIKSIREFLAKKGQAFYNNIIVALPDGVYFEDKDMKIKTVEEFDAYNVCSMILPDRMNSICIIDGQHRVYAHYEGDTKDANEEKIAALRKKLHLLVTGLVFPPQMSITERTRIQSEIFLEINSKAKPVPPDIILHIEQLKSPLSDKGLARAVIERLNKERIFLNKFEMSALDEGKIKIASIIKFALRYLVTIVPKEKKSFYSYWDGDKNALQKLQDDAFDSYLNFCVKNLSIYFSAIRNNFIDAWNDPTSKLLSVISINGFIIAYNRFLDIYGIKDFAFFNKQFKNLKTDFSKEKFPYTSSRYKQFSEEILKDALFVGLKGEEENGEK